MNKCEADSNLYEKPLNELKRKVTMNAEGSAVEKAKGETLVNQPAVFIRGGIQGYIVTGLTSLLDEYALRASLRPLCQTPLAFSVSR